MSSVRGSCLCGNVKISAELASENLGACHCGMCRRWSAGPFLAVDAGQSAAFEGEEHISVFVSSDWAERGFCKNCGSSLFYRLKQNSQYMLSSELFDEVAFKFDHQIFIDRKPNYYEFANPTANMTEQEVFDKFGGA